MTIHHDKLAYGKLAATQEDLSEERVLEMMRILSESGGEEEYEEAEEKEMITAKTQEEK